MPSGTGPHDRAARLPHIATLREKNHDINRDYHVLEQVL